MDNREVSEKYANIGAELIETEPALEHLKNVSIMYLASEHKKLGTGKIIYAQCEKVPTKYKWGIPCDFTITVFEPNVEGFSDEQLRILIFHELLHVGVEDDKLFIVPHDLEDFKLIVNRYGTDWSTPDWVPIE